MAMWYRASQIKDKQHVFSGDGGLFTSGRWNHRGRKTIYCSESIALCTLEWLSHHGLSVSGFHYYRYSIDVPDELVHRFTPSDLPKEWKTTPTTNVTQDFAEQHLFLSKKIMALAVPSVLIPEEFNLIINPSHPDFSSILKTVKVFPPHLAPVRSAS